MFGGPRTNCIIHSVFSAEEQSADTQTRIISYVAEQSDKALVSSQHEGYQVSMDYEFHSSCFSQVLY